ncbi:DUF3099 domain-containing protein [Actinomadura sp. WMMA1423]|uniref:DUF3099 domain-containing protein n=1 Tax=Actinomadura sp. WMMA1423 TaxID=2591108 RepID=UPI001F0E6E0B|nr:DUF3099 domain-containing protein [Actinomadura sp. WMMA1423]
MKVNPRHHREPAVYTVTDAPRPMSEDIGHRQRRYLVSMAVRTLCFVGAVVAAVAGAPWWLAVLMVVAAAILPYVAVVFANGGARADGPGGLRRPRRQGTQAGFRTASGNPVVTFS